jgi:peptidyl-prolyl cis-trans isomerase C
MRPLREPLLHFFVLGVALLALHRWTAPPAESPRRIDVSDAIVRGLRQEHLRRTGTWPSADEEAALVRRWVDDEVLVREATARGLDRGDLIVRRRLIQKMEFLTEDLEPVPAPTDAELETWIAAHPDRYGVPDRISFVHVFVSTDLHGAETAAEAARLRERLVAGAEPAALGDPFLLGRELRLRSAVDLAGSFGASFGAGVMGLDAGVWSEPIPSAFGLHLVRVTAHQPGHGPRLAEVRDAAVRDWTEDRRTAINRAALDRLRAGYDVRIEAGGSEPTAVAVAP